MKHLTKMGLILTNTVLGLTGWGILWWLIYRTTKTPDNRITINTNSKGEMWPEFALGIFALFFTTAFNGYLLTREVKEEQKKK